jgi:predicted AlkP superfamily pyrophosphatase or phosphodiesterase
MAQRGQPAAAITRTITNQPPRLVVFLVIDQMRADYINLYGHQWTKGLRRLLDTGAYFPMAAYPYSYTVTCAGHATIGTGSYPATHGMIGNEWYDRERQRNVPCTEDPGLTSVPFGGTTGSEHHGPTRLATLTFADELKMQAPRPPTIASVSLKARSSITFAGRPSPSTYVVWLEETTGSWATSSAYASAPWPMVDAYVKAHPVFPDYGQVWTRARPASTYLFSDAGPNELAPAEFPHPITSKTGKPDSEFITRWRRSPLSDRYVGQLAQHLARNLKLGQSPGTDMLSVSFSATDLVGHEYGPHSHEVQDILLRVDEQIGELLSALDQLVGRDRYVVALSSDHGVALVPEQDESIVAGSGRMSSTAMRTMINTAIESVLGPGTHVTARTGPNVYLAPGVLPRLLSTAGARETVTKAIESFEGLARVYWAPDLASGAATDDRFLRAARLSYMPGRSGDLMVIPDPFWMAQAAGTTHGTPYDYDQRVPLLFAGAGIKPGRYLVPSSPADIAPTFAFLTGITMARTDGVVRTEALR